MFYFRKLFPINFRTIIPNTLTDELTYYEDLCKLNDKVIEILKALYGLDDEIDKVINEALKPVYEYIDSKDAEIKDLIIAAENRLNTSIIHLYNLIGYKSDIINNRIDKEISDLYEYISNLNIEGFIMFNPTNGKTENVKKVIYDIYEFLRYHAITAYWYDTRGLTASEYDSLKLTAKKYDLYATDYIRCDYYHNAFNYKTGAFESIQRFLYQLVQEIRPDAMTTTVFDNLELSATDFDTLEDTALELDTTTITI